jgi:hypothetical protein
MTCGHNGLAPGARLVPLIVAMSRAAVASLLGVRSQRARPGDARARSPDQLDQVQHGKQSIDFKAA